MGFTFPFSRFWPKTKLSCSSNNTRQISSVLLCEYANDAAQVWNYKKAIVDYTSPGLCTPITPSRRQVMWPMVSMPEDDRATDICNIHKKIWYRSRVWFRRYPRGQTDMQTDILITILRNHSRGEV